MKSLADSNKRQRAVDCLEMTRVFSTERNVRQRLIVTDEKWFYERPIGCLATRRS